ncbi:uncharacterized protein FFNC_15528 [Fusarium fujikuroi]|nr:uncharacterized protein FFNC_15528 [Fusarium fujikuroi]
MSSVHADSSETWKALFPKNEQVFERDYDDDDFKEDFKTFLELQEYGLLVLDYKANWRGTAQWPEDESERGIPWLLFAVMDDTVAPGFIEKLRDQPTFHVTTWQLHGRKPDKPRHPDYFYKYYRRPSDSESNNWTGEDNRSDDPMLSLEAFQLEHLKFDVHVCEVGIRSDIKPVGDMSSEEFYKFIETEDLDLVDFALTAYYTFIRQQRKELQRLDEKEDDEKEDDEKEDNEKEVDDDKTKIKALKGNRDWMNEIVALWKALKAEGYIERHCEKTPTRR